MERAELLSAFIVDAHDDLDEDELLLLAVFFSRRSVPPSLLICTSCGLCCAVCHAQCSNSGDVQVKGYGNVTVRTNVEERRAAMPRVY